MSERVGVLGGTFDPPHLGHLVVAEEAAGQLDLDPVLLVPSGQPPHKPEGAQLDAPLRARLVAAAVKHHRLLALWDGEISRPGTSFTADTMEEIAAERPAASLWFILGTDQLRGFQHWHEPERILAVARLAVVARSGDDPVRAGANLPKGAQIDVVSVPRIDISSTMIRRRMATGRPFGALVPDAVGEALRREGLVAPRRP